MTRRDGETAIEVGELRASAPAAKPGLGLLLIRVEAVAPGESSVSLGAAALADSTGLPYALEPYEARIVVREGTR